ncbi:MAG: T9SS type A sorting domain-containing protein, partial [Bacteroidales bacterium]|nr:T9SS type A sorting domain-containing protein [Bacteroidales bacterium]
TGQADLIWESNIDYLKGDELSKFTIDSDFNTNLNSRNASDSKTVWLTLSPSSGSIASGASQIIAAVFNPGDALNEYWHQANILLSSNDPLNPVLTVSAEMYIGWTNLSEQPMEQIMIGPIPSNGSLHIKLIDDITAIQMLSLTGQQIFLTNVFGIPHVKIDLNDYKSGTYVLKFIHKSGDIALRKIVLF